MTLAVAFGIGMASTASRHCTRCCTCPRAWIARPDPAFLPAVERQLTIGPTGVQDKERGKFVRRWAELTGEEMAPAV